MSDLDLNAEIRKVAERFFTTRATGLLGSAMPPFDTSKPNFHDNKSDFLREKRFVEAQLENAHQLFDAIFSTIEDDDPNQDMALVVAMFVDVHARRKVENMSVDSAEQLVRKNVVELSLTRNLLFLLLDLRSALSARVQELADQEAEFWSGKSRPPNHYARTIALRFARLIAKETGQKPTFGTSKDGSHPSTDFGRALEDVFKLLEIKANVNRAAKWAIDQLGDEDLAPVPNMLGGLAGFVGANPQNALINYMKSQSKGQ